MKLQILIGRTVQSFRLPDRDDPNAYVVLDEVCNVICEEGARRQARHAKLVSGTRSWFAPIAYDLISHLLCQRLEHLLTRRAVRLGRHRRTQEYSKNRWTGGILGILAKDEFGYDDQERGRLGDQLIYAYRHYVPTCFLDGFVQTAGKLDQKKAMGPLRAGFETWVAEHHAIDPRENDYRGEYSPEIESEVRRLRAGAPGIVGPWLQALNAAKGESSVDKDDVDLRLEAAMAKRDHIGRVDEVELSEAWLAVEARNSVR